MTKEQNFFEQLCQMPRCVETWKLGLYGEEERNLSLLKLTFLPEWLEYSSVSVFLILFVREIETHRNDCCTEC